MKMEHPVKSLVNRIWSMAQVEQKPKFQDEAAAMEQAVAVLLVNAARVDGAIHETQKTMVLELLREKFGLSESGAIRLFNAAGLRLRKPIDMYKLANKVVERMEIEDRLQLLSMVRRVVLADGALDPEEARLLNEMGRMLKINVRDVTQVRAQVRNMLGRPVEPYVNAGVELRRRSTEVKQERERRLPRSIPEPEMQPRRTTAGVSINGRPIMAYRPSSGDGAVELTPG